MYIQSKVEADYKDQLEGAGAKGSGMEGNMHQVNSIHYGNALR